MPAHEISTEVLGLINPTTLQVGELAVALASSHFTRSDLGLDVKAQIAHELGGIFEHLNNIEQLTLSSVEEPTHPFLHVVSEQHLPDLTRDTVRLVAESTVDPPHDQDDTEALEIGAEVDVKAAEQDPAAIVQDSTEPVSTVIGSQNTSQADAKEKIIINKSTQNEPKASEVIKKRKTGEIIDQDIETIKEILKRYPDRTLRRSDFLEEGYAERLSTESSKYQNFARIANRMFSDPLINSLGFWRIGNRSSSKYVYRKPADPSTSQSTIIDNVESVNTPETTEPAVPEKVIPKDVIELTSWGLCLERKDKHFILSVDGQDLDKIFKNDASRSQMNAIFAAYFARPNPASSIMLPDLAKLASVLCLEYPIDDDHLVGTVKGLLQHFMNEMKSGFEFNIHSKITLKKLLVHGEEQQMFQIAGSLDRTKEQQEEILRSLGYKEKAIKTFLEQRV